MITDSEVYSDLLNLSKKMEFLADPKNTNTEKSNFWKMLKSRLDKSIIEYVERDKRLFGW